MMDSQVQLRVCRTEKSINVAAATHTGRRIVNADAHWIDEKAGFFAVADGMGDTARSTVAARMALDAVGEQFFGPWALSPAERSASKAAVRMGVGLLQAHRRLCASGRSKRDEIGTTFAGIVAGAGWICTGHIGDSRAYLLRRSRAYLLRHPKPKLAQLTMDHTIAGEAVHRGVGDDVAAALPRAAEVTRMLGVTSLGDGAPIFCTLWEPGDAVLLCTDGVSDRVEIGELATILLDAGDAGDAADRIVARATDAGGGDNATALVASWRT
jgi:PPM family protein phosphatase